MNIDEYLLPLSKCCLLHEEGLLNQISALDIDEEIIRMLSVENHSLARMVSLIVKSFHGETRKDGSSRTLHAYDVARIALQGVNFLHPSILKQWKEKETEALVLSALAHDLLEDGHGVDKSDIAQLFFPEVSDIVFELTDPKQKNNNDEGKQLYVQKFNLFSIELTCHYPTAPFFEDHFHLPPSAIGAYVKLCDTVSSLRANVLRGIPGWDQEKYHQLILNFRETIQNLSSLNPFVWNQFELISEQLKAKWNR